MNVWKKLFQKFNPVTEIINHAKIVEEASDWLPELFKKYLNGEDITEILKTVDKLESDADNLKRNFREKLKRGNMYRFERVDLLDFIDTQDKIADCIEDLTKMMSMNTVPLENDIKEQIMGLVNEVESMLDVFKKTVNYLENIVSSNFSTESKLEEERGIVEIKWYERDIDNKSFELGKWLYAQKETMNAVDIFFLRNMILKLSQIADTSQNVTDRIHILINE